MKSAKFIFIKKLPSILKYFLAYNENLPQQPTLDDWFTKVVQEDVSKLTSKGQLRGAEEVFLYGYYKQATLGDVNTARPGGIGRAREKAEWDQWFRHKGTANAQSRLNYINFVRAKQGQPPLKLSDFRATNSFSTPSKKSGNKSSFIVSGTTDSNGVDTRKPNSKEMVLDELFFCIAKNDDDTDLGLAKLVWHHLKTQDMNVTTSSSLRGLNSGRARDLMIEVYALFMQGYRGDCPPEEEERLASVTKASMAALSSKKKYELDKKRAWLRKKGTLPSIAKWTYVRAMLTTFASILELPEFKSTGIQSVVSPPRVPSIDKFDAVPMEELQRLYKESLAVVSKLSEVDAAFQKASPSPINGREARSSSVSVTAKPSLSVPVSVSVPVAVTNTNGTSTSSSKNTKTVKRTVMRTKTVETPAKYEIDSRFLQLSEDIKGFMKNMSKLPPNDVLLSLYSNFKQATEGDNNSAEPSRFSVQKRAKWEAWNKVKGKGKEEAKKSYIESVSNIMGLEYNETDFQAGSKEIQVEEEIEEEVEDQDTDHGKEAKPTYQQQHHHHQQPVQRPTKTVKRTVMRTKTVETPAKYEIDSRFLQLSEDIKGFMKNMSKLPPNDVLLSLYGNFKQATEGDNNSAEPSRFSVQKRAKWEAWNKVKGKGKEEAKKSYIESVSNIMGLEYNETDFQAGSKEIQVEEEIEEEVEDKDNDHMNGVSGVHKSLTGAFNSATTTSIATGSSSSSNDEFYDATTYPSLPDLNTTDFDSATSRSDVSGQLSALQSEILSLYSHIQSLNGRLETLSSTLSTEQLLHKNMTQRLITNEVQTRDTFDAHNAKIQQLRSDLGLRSEVEASLEQRVDRMSRQAPSSRTALFTGVSFLVLWPAITMYLYRRYKYRR